MKKGDVIKGPDGMGYEATRDINCGELITTACLKPVGGAPQPVVGEVIPEWAWKGITSGS